MLSNANDRSSPAKTCAEMCELTLGAAAWIQQEFNGKRVAAGGLHMPAYRVYCLDGAGKVWAAEWIQAESDSAALGAAREFAGSAHCEVWLGQRLVGKVEPQPDLQVD
jgi:hypothetical protein